MEKAKLSLVEQVENLKPRFTNADEGIRVLGKELELIASRNGVSVDELLASAHDNYDPENADYLKALSLSKQIRLLKRKQK